MARHGFKAEANRISVRVRAKLGLRPEEPISPKKVCTAFDINLRPLSSVDIDCAEFLIRDTSAFSAITFEKGISRYIVFNDAHHLYRQNSDICHELGHCFLGHSGPQLLMEDGNRTYNKQMEEEASLLSGYLLLTNEACDHILRNGLQSTAQTLYGVSSQMYQFRLGASGAFLRDSRRKASRSP